MKHKRYNHPDQRITDSFPLSSNRYNPLCNDSEGDDTPVRTEKSRALNFKHIRKYKLDRRKRVLEKKQHKVIILGDSHARECATKVGRLLNNDFEVLGFVNAGSGMKYIKDTFRMKLQ
jgi:hypothetical protein